MSLRTCINGKGSPCTNRRRCGCGHHRRDDRLSIDAVFRGSNDDASAAARISRTINRARDQARRRNRAYVVDFALMVANRPGGRIDFYESKSASCNVSIDNVVANRRTQYTLSNHYRWAALRLMNTVDPMKNWWAFVGGVWVQGPSRVSVFGYAWPRWITSIAERQLHSHCRMDSKYWFNHGAGHLGQPVVRCGESR